MPRRRYIPLDLSPSPLAAAAERSSFQEDERKDDENVGEPSSTSITAASSSPLPNVETRPTSYDPSPRPSAPCSPRTPLVAPDICAGEDARPNRADGAIRSSAGNTARTAPATGPFAPQAQSRSGNVPPTSSARLQIGKPGTQGSSNWAFGNGLGQNSATSSLSQPRTSNGIQSFAQTIGSSQPSTPLDLSEFPSLTSNQTSQQNQAQSAWNAQSQRGGPSWTTPGRNQDQPVPGQHLHEGLLSAFSTQPRSDSRGGNPTNTTAASLGPKNVSHADEFPPLNVRTANVGGTIGEESKGLGYMQQHSKLASSAFNGISPSRGPMNQDRQGVSMPSLPINNNSAMEQPVNHTVQTEGRFERTEAGHRLQGGNPNPSLAHSAYRKQQQSLDPSGHASFGNASFERPSGEMSRFPVNHASEFDGSARPPLPLHALPPRERYGMSGLLTLMKHDSPQSWPLARGQDLTSLQLDIDDPASLPLHKTFASPWPETSTRPIEPEFEVPACYRVENVPQLHGKISSLTEETLFYAFYSVVGDIFQELAAQELISRGWRYLKPEQTWLCKDPGSSPNRLSDGEEQGKYVIWNKAQWRREMREIRLQYSDLDDHTPLQGLAPHGPTGLANGKQIN